MAAAHGLPDARGHADGGETKTEAKQNWLSGRFRDASIRYEAAGVRVQEREAAVIGKITSSQRGAALVQYHSLIFGRHVKIVE